MIKISNLKSQISKKLQASSFKLHDRGFTLIEAIVAIGVISVGFVGALVILSKSASQAGFLRERIIASHLAAEGIEVIGNIRDTNWLKSQTDWLSGLGDTSNGLVDYNSQSLLNNSIYNSCLNYVSGFYKHGTSASCNTVFKRHIVLTKKSEIISGQSVVFLEVQSIVDWQEKGQTKTIQVIDNLYDWK